MGRGVVVKARGGVGMLMLAVERAPGEELDENEDGAAVVRQLVC